MKRATCEGRVRGCADGVTVTATILPAGRRLNAVKRSMPETMRSRSAGAFAGRAPLAGVLALACLLGPGVLSAQAQSTERINRSTAGVQGNSITSQQTAMTPDGRFVAFTSAANNLVPGDNNNYYDVFVRDRLLNTTVRVSVPDLSTGFPEGNGVSGLGPRGGVRRMSDDGRFVVFSSEADNLVLGDTNQVTDIFVRDRDLDGNGIFDEPGAGRTKTVRVNVSSSENQTQGNCPGGTCSHHSYNGTISANGRFVAFEAWTNSLTGDSNLGGYSNIYLRDRDADNDGIFDEAGGAPDAATTVLVGKPIVCVGCAHDGYTADPAISADGRHVAFISRSSRMVFSDTNDVVDVFVRDMLLGTTARVSVSSAGGQSLGADSNMPSISDDGRYIAFASGANNLVAGDGGQTDVFVHDRDADNDGIFDEAGAISTEIVSLGWSPFPLPGGSVVKGNATSYQPAISGDGRFVSFTTAADNLIGCLLIGCGDTNTATDIYVRDRLIQVTDRVSLTNAGNQADSDSNASTISANGMLVAFTSRATDLVLPDNNGNTYDAYLRNVDKGPKPTAAVSRKAHGVAGSFNTDVSVGSAVECRSGGPTQVIVTFNENIQGIGGLDTGDVALTSGSVSGVSISGGNTLTVNMNGATDAATLVMSFPGIENTSGYPVTRQLCFGVLVGDANGDRTVNVLDLVVVRNVLNSVTGAGNFRSDPNTDGTVNVLDLVAIRNNLNTAVSGSCP